MFLSLPLSRWTDVPATRTRPPPSSDPWPHVTESRRKLSVISPQGCARCRFQSQEPCLCYGRTGLSVPADVWYWAKSSCKFIVSIKQNLNSCMSSGMVMEMIVRVSIYVFWLDLSSDSGLDSWFYSVFRWQGWSRLLLSPDKLLRGSQTSPVSLQPPPHSCPG